MEAAPPPAQRNSGGGSRGRGQGYNRKSQRNNKRDDAANENTTENTSNDSGSANPRPRSQNRQHRPHNNSAQNQGQPQNQQPSAVANPNPSPNANSHSNSNQNAQRSSSNSESSQNGAGSDRRGGRGGYRRYRGRGGRVATSPRAYHSADTAAEEIPSTAAPADPVAQPAPETQTVVGRSILSEVLGFMQLNAAPRPSDSPSAAARVDPAILTASRADGPIQPVPVSAPSASPNPLAASQLLSLLKGSPSPSSQTPPAAMPTVLRSAPHSQPQPQNNPQVPRPQRSPPPGFSMPASVHAHQQPTAATSLPPFPPMPLAPKPTALGMHPPVLETGNLTDESPELAAITGASTVSIDLNISPSLQRHMDMLLLEQDGDGSARGKVALPAAAIPHSEDELNHHDELHGGEVDGGDGDGHDMQQHLDHLDDGADDEDGHAFLNANILGDHDQDEEEEDAGHHGHMGLDHSHQQAGPFSHVSPFGPGFFGPRVGFGFGAPPGPGFGPMPPLPMMMHRPFDPQRLQGANFVPFAPLGPQGSPFAPPGHSFMPHGFPPRGPPPPLAFQFGGGPPPSRVGMSNMPPGMSMSMPGQSPSWPTSPSNSLSASSASNGSNSTPATSVGVTPLVVTSLTDPSWNPIDRAASAASAPTELPKAGPLPAPSSQPLPQPSQQQQQPQKHSGPQSHLGLRPAQSSPPADSPSLDPVAAQRRPRTFSDERDISNTPLGPANSPPFGSQAPPALSLASHDPRYDDKKHKFSKRGANPEAAMRLDMELRQLVVRLLPPDRIYLEREDIRRRVEIVVRSLFPDAKLHSFGSSVTRLCCAKSDMDVCMQLNRDGLDEKELIEPLAKALEKDFKNVNPLPKARVPIVKFSDPVTGLNVDIGINNMLAVENSKLIRDYVSLDSRGRDLCYLVKQWAKVRKINDPYRGTLSSYAYVLMLVFFLQTRSPPVLPCLQKLATEKVIIGEYDCSYYKNIQSLRGFSSNNTETLGQLLVEFMRLFAHEFDFKNSVVCIRTGGLLSKKDKNWTESKGRDRHWFSIEDPFEVTHDLGRVCDRVALHEIRGEFMRAHRILCESGDFMKVCEPYTEEWRGS